MICLHTLLSWILLYMDFPLTLSVFDIFWISMKSIFSFSQFLLLSSKPCKYHVFLLKSNTFLSTLALSVFLVGMVIYIYGILHNYQLILCLINKANNTWNSSANNSWNNTSMPLPLHFLNYPKPPTPNRRDGTSLWSL